MLATIGRRFEKKGTYNLKDAASNTIDEQNHLFFPKVLFFRTYV